MIPVPSGVRVWLAVSRTDMRRGMNGLALQVQGKRSFKSTGFSLA
jgi:transposase